MRFYSIACHMNHKGCRPFMCDTDHSHSNCLERFKTAHGLPVASETSSSISGATAEIFQVNPATGSSRPICPLSRGEVIGWGVVNEARVHLNVKKRCCQEKECPFVGNYMELQVHTIRSITRGMARRHLFLPNKILHSILDSSL